MNSTLKVGVVGFGFATATFHAPLIASVPGLALTAISSSDPAKVRAAWPQVDTCESPDALFARPDIDLVVIPTPNETHYPLAVKALAAGKHVVVDKPFTLDAAEARDLIARADAAGRVLSVFHNRRWDADFLTVKQILASGELGRLTHFESHFDRFRPLVRQRWRESGAPGSGLWYDLGSHLLDQALQLFGTPQIISLDLAKQRDGAAADDWFHAVLRYDGLRVILHASALVGDLGPRFALHGTRGSFSKFGLDPQEDALKLGGRPGAADWGVDPRPGTLTTSEGDALISREFAGERGDYSRYYAAVRDAILQGASNPVPASDALKVMQLIDLGLASFREGRVAPVVGLD
ncbi:oxidoreductase [Niveibacterium umoris]|uniref:Putative dehydrogenase n=1 Tax=Niveibacterium umoris TaxID=1193620 RepID=A0A840BPM2_9RHOO|nr:oxidoreductase [Niveibacterium umoris]MBB4012796.1 putative dehydrogenase [Niveibacterium umoris]